MAWDESKHPRDGDGRFSENPHERDEKKRDAVRHIYDSDGGAETVKAKVKAVLAEGHELPLNRDGSLNKMALNRRYEALRQKEPDINGVVAEINADPTHANEIFQKAIATGRINTSLHRGNQYKHIEGTQNYKQEVEQGRWPSILTVDAAELLQKYAGKGKLYFDRSGKFTGKEVFVHDGPIGIYRNKRFEISVHTNVGKIHYSNKGAHIVPDEEDR